MDRPGEDAAARAERLERWATEQERLSSPSPRRGPRHGRRPKLDLQRRTLRLERRLQALVDGLLYRGLDTGTRSVEPEHLDAERLPYAAVPVHVLPRALRTIGVGPEDTFVDFGCGKGRVLLQAARRPFRRVVGVEISPGLVDVARAALAARSRRQRCGEVEVVAADAREFPIPDDMTIGFFYDPFRGEVFDAVLRGIVESMDRRPRRVHLVYAHPILASRILETGRFRVVKRQRGGLLSDNFVASAVIFEGR